MKKPKIFEKVANTAAKAKFKVGKHSPEILLVAGIAGVIAGTVAACKATTKVSKIREEQREQLDAISKAKEEGEICIEDDDGDIVTVDYTKKDAKKDALIVYKNSAIEYVKLYFPSVVILTLSIGSIIASHGTLKKRGIAAAAAYGAIDKSFKDYRRRVVERFGPEVDKELRYGVRTEAVTREETDGKGKKRKITVAEKSFESIDYNDEFAVFFDEASTEFQKDSVYNFHFLEIQQNYCNQLLHSRGYLFLNEVREALGLPKTKAGQVVGWIYDENDNRYANFVDFGIYEFDNEAKKLFRDGKERSILLEFNCDGYILDKVDLES